MNNVGLIWQYGENVSRSETIETNQILRQSYQDVQREDYPILGRRLELMIVTTQLMLLDEPPESQKRRRDLAAIIFEGKENRRTSSFLHFVSSRRR